MTPSEKIKRLVEELRDTHRHPHPMDTHRDDAAKLIEALWAVNECRTAATGFHENTDPCPACRAAVDLDLALANLNTLIQSIQE